MLGMGFLHYFFIVFSLFFALFHSFQLFLALFRYFLLYYALSCSIPLFLGLFDSCFAFFTLFDYFLPFLLLYLPAHYSSWLILALFPLHRFTFCFMYNLIGKLQTDDFANRYRASTIGQKRLFNRKGSLLKDQVNLLSNEVSFI